MPDLVCPDCGHGQFIVRAYQVIEETVEVSPHGEWTVDDNVIDYERSDDPLKCDDCSGEWDADELITPEQYEMYNEELSNA